MKKKNLIRWIMVVVPMMMVFIATDCKHNPVDPGDTTKVDTTSHAFTFQQYSWGNNGSSYFQDVAILSDTNIWAVGEIQILEYDSSGNQITSPYGAAHWDGTSWKLVAVYDNLYNLAIAPIQGIYAVGSNDFWFAAGSIFHWDGISKQAKLSLSRFDISSSNTMITKIWGTSSSNVYGVGTGGVVVHFDGTSWQKLSSPTTLDIMDIYGATNSSTGKVEILAVATNLANPALALQTQLLRIDGTTVTQVGSTLPTSYSSVWFVPGEKYYLVGNGVLSRATLSDTGWVSSPMGTITQDASTSIRGANQNDIVIVGNYFDAEHYNGVSWYCYNNLYNNNGVFSRAIISGNTMIAVGFVDQAAVIIMGKR